MRVLAQKGINALPRQMLALRFDVPKLHELAKMERYAAWLGARGIKVAIFDPFYLMTSGVDMRDMNQVGAALLQLDRIFSKYGITVGIAHHASKSSGPRRNEAFRPMTLSDLAYAGLEQYVRQWILIARRVAFDANEAGRHELFLSVGGSAGHCGEFHLDVEEGQINDDHGGRHWQPTVTRAGVARAAQAENREAEREAKRQRQREDRANEAFALIHLRHTAGNPLTKTSLRDLMACGTTGANAAIEMLLMAERIMIEPGPGRNGRATGTLVPAYDPAVSAAPDTPADPPAAPDAPCPEGSEGSTSVAEQGGMV